MIVKSASDLRISLTVLNIVYPIFVLSMAIHDKSLLALVLLAPTILLIRAWVVLGRTLIFSKEGCTVKFMFYSKTYKWQELKTKQIKDFSNGISYKEQPFKQGTIFCSKSINFPKKLKPAGFNYLYRPFGFFFVYFKPCSNYYANKSLLYSDLYVVNEDEFRNNLKKWKVDIEDLVKNTGDDYTS